MRISQRLKADGDPRAQHLQAHMILSKDVRDAPHAEMRFRCFFMDCKALVWKEAAMEPFIGRQRAVRIVQGSIVPCNEGIQGLQRTEGAAPVTIRGHDGAS